MKTAITKIWNYFESMNSEDTKVSIKRNISWALLMLIAWVEVYSLLQERIKLDAEEFIGVCKFYAVLDLAAILLILRITSLEKIQGVIQSIKGGSPDATQKVRLKQTNTSETEVETAQ